MKITKTLLVLLIAANSTIAFSQSKQENVEINNKKVEQLLNDFYRFWETVDESLLEKTVSKKVIDHDKDPRSNETDYNAILSLGRAVQGVTLKHEITQVYKLAKGKYLVRWEGSGKHTGDFFGVPATNRTVYFNGHDIIQIENDKIVELWHIEQLLQLMGQIQ